MKIYNVGLIGFGFIGKVHAYGHRNIPLFYDQEEFATAITKVCTAKPETAARAARMLGGSVEPVTDFHAITDDPAIDIVDICTPNAAHAETLLAAMKAQKHIYCDKPLCATSAEADAIENALPAYRGVAQMTLQNRFFPATLRAKQLIDSGLIGEVLEFRGQYLHSGSADPAAPLKWKLEAGTIADLGSHILDLMTWLLGDFTALAAATHIAYPDRPDAADPAKRLPVTAEDNMTVIAKLANGASGVITASKIATGVEDGFGFAIHGSKGALRWKPMELDKLYYYNAAAPGTPQGGLRGWTAIDCGQRYDKPAGFPTPKAPIGWLRGHMHCLYRFLEAVHTGRATGPGLADGIKIQRLMAKVKEAASCGEWVNL